MKDTNNKLEYNSWSGTDYNNDTSQYNTGSVNCISSQDWSYNGESSLKATGSFNQLFDVGRINFNKDVNVSSSIVVYNPDCPVRVYLRSYSSNLAYADIAAGNPKNVYLSAVTVDDEWVTIRLMIKAENGGTFYLDSPSIV